MRNINDILNILNRHNIINIDNIISMESFLSGMRFQLFQKDYPCAQIITGVLQVFPNA